MIGRLLQTMVDQASSLILGARHFSAEMSEPMTHLGAQRWFHLDRDNKRSTTYVDQDGGSLVLVDGAQLIKFDTALAEHFILECSSLCRRT